MSTLFDKSDVYISTPYNSYIMAWAIAKAGNLCNFPYLLSPQKEPETNRK